MGLEGGSGEGLGEGRGGGGLGLGRGGVESGARGGWGRGGAGLGRGYGEATPTVLGPGSFPGRGQVQADLGSPPAPHPRGCPEEPAPPHQLPEAWSGGPPSSSLWTPGPEPSSLQRAGGPPTRTLRF